MLPFLACVVFVSGVSAFLVALRLFLANSVFFRGGFGLSVASSLGSRFISAPVCIVCSSSLRACGIAFLLNFRFVALPHLLRIYFVRHELQVALFIGIFCDIWRPSPLYCSAISPAVGLVRMKAYLSDTESAFCAHGDFSAWEVW